MERLTTLPQSDLYVVYSMSNSPYQQWQADLLDFSVREVAQAGTVVRLCSQDANHPDLDVSPSSIGYTFATPSFTALGGAWVGGFIRWVKHRLGMAASGRFHFHCLNKPFAMKAFLETHSHLDDEALIMWLDPDMVFNRPWEAPHERALPGHVCGQRWWGYDRDWCLNSVGDRERASIPASGSALMFPFCITVADMRRIAAPFCRLSKEIYHKTGDWKSEMAALVTSVSMAGLKCHTIAALGTCNNWPDELSDDPSAPISHYTQPVTDQRGIKIWNKRTYTSSTLTRPWDRPPDPAEAATLTDRRALEMLHRFIDQQEEDVLPQPRNPV